MLAAGVRLKRLKTWNRHRCSSSASASALASAFADHHQQSSSRWSSSGASKIKQFNVRHWWCYEV